MLALEDYRQAVKDWRYVPETGALIKIGGRIQKNSNPDGGLGWVKNSGGYRMVFWRGKMTLVHRLIWLLQTARWPDRQIDHQNRIRTDNRWQNLKTATNLTNSQNTSINRNNTSGHRGVYWHGKRRKWQVSIQRNSVLTYIGLYATRTEAVKAWHVADKDPSRGPCGCAKERS